MRELPVAEAKRDFKRVLDAAERGESTLITRNGRPAAVIGPAPEPRIARRAPRPLPKSKEPGGLLSLAGLLADWETIEEDIAQIIAERQLDMGRPPPELD